MQWLCCHFLHGNSSGFKFGILGYSSTENHISEFQVKSVKNEVVIPNKVLECFYTIQGFVTCFFKFKLMSGSISLRFYTWLSYISRIYCVKFDGEIMEQYWDIRDTKCGQNHVWRHDWKDFCHPTVHMYVSSVWNSKLAA